MNAERWTKDDVRAVLNEVGWPNDVLCQTHPDAPGPRACILRCYLEEVLWSRWKVRLIRLHTGKWDCFDHNVGRWEADDPADCLIRTATELLAREKVAAPKPAAPATNPSPAPPEFHNGQRVRVVDTPTKPTNEPYGPNEEEGAFAGRGGVIKTCHPEDGVVSVRFGKLSLLCWKHNLIPLPEECVSVAYPRACAMKAESERDAALFQLEALQAQLDAVRKAVQ